jgi:hypothetical protein
MNVSGMVEYDEKMVRYVNAEAYIKRVRTRISNPVDKIPYYHWGMGDGLFSLMSDGGRSDDIKQALRDIAPDAVVSVSGGRNMVVNADLRIEV